MSKKQKQKQKLEDSKDIRLAIGKYLQDNGWNVILVADHGIKELDKNRYEYFMQFLGSKKE